MKLKMSLTRRPGLIHMIPGLDILALVLVFPLLGLSFTSISGVEIGLPESPHRLKRMERSIEVSVKGVGDLQIWVNKNKVSEDALLNVLKNEALNWSGGGKVGVILKVDRQVSSGDKDRIVDLLASLSGFKIYDARR